MLVVAADELENDPRTTQVEGNRVSRKFLYRDREFHHGKLYQNYFFDRSTYRPVKFHTRFRMRQNLFLCIVEALLLMIHGFYKERMH